MSNSQHLPAYSMNRSDFPQMYERAIVPVLFRPWAELTLDRAAPVRGARVLDVACGTGIVARLAHARGAGTVVGVDVSGPMLEVAKAIAPSVDWREGDAARLPLSDGEQFDVITCQQGFQFFGDRAAAARELERVIAPHGRAFVATWRGNEEMPVLDRLKRVAERHLGAAIEDQRHALGNGAELARLLSDAGFRSVDVETLHLPLTLPGGADFVRMNAIALVGMSGAKLEPAEQERLLAEIVRESLEVAGLRADGVLAFDMVTNFATAAP